MLQDMLLKYGVGLQNNDQSVEATEIYYFLEKMATDMKIKRSVKKLLSGMDSEGSMEPLNDMIEDESIKSLSGKLDRRLELGVRVENLLNLMGKKFQFKTMMRDIADDILDITSEYIEIFEQEQEFYAEKLASSFEILLAKEQKLNKTDSEMGWKMEEVIYYINAHIGQMIRKQEQEAKKASLCAIGSLFIPGVPFTKAVGQGTTAYIRSQAKKWLQDQTCEELKFFDFLIEFSGAFAQLGTDIALLRTKEDFQTFDFGGLKRFKNAEVFSMLQDEGFY